MAIAISSSIPSISRFERNELEFGADMIIAIKKFLDIEKAPLFAHELTLYRDRIWVWNELLDTGRMDEARAMQEEMAIILNLPFEHDLYLLYLVTEAMLLSKEYNIPATEEKLKIVEGLLDNASDGALNLYHRNKGFICLVAGDMKSGIKHSIKAVEHAEADKKTDTSALNNIGQAYIVLGKPYHAIIYIERARAQFTGDLTHKRPGHMTQALAMCYTLVGEYRKAEKLVELSLMQAKSTNASSQIAQALTIMASLKLKSKKYDECLVLCDEGLPYYNGDKEMYVSLLTTKAECLLRMKKYKECQEILNHGRAVLQEGEKKMGKTTTNSDILEIAFSTFEHQMTLDNDESVNYIQNVAIPHFIKAGGKTKLTAIGLCHILESHFIKKRAKTKANAIAVISRDIYKEMFMVEEEYD